MEDRQHAPVHDREAARLAGHAAAVRTEGERGLERAGILQVTEKTQASLAGLRALQARAADAQCRARAFEWLSDNFYMLERESRDALSSLRRMSGRLRAPRARTGVPAVLTLARALLDFAQTQPDGLTRSLLSDFLEGAQEVRVLSEAELWSVVPMLKCAAVLHAARMTDVLGGVLDGVHKNPEDNPYAAERAVAAARAEGRGVPDAVLALSEEAERTHAVLSDTFAFVFAVLRFLAGTELHDTLRGASRLDAALAKDPAGVYPRMDERSQAYYRAALSRLAKQAGISETEAAARCLALCDKASDARMRHVGYYILEMPLGRAGKRTAGRAYAALIWGLPVAIAVMAGLLLRSVAAGLLLWLPLFELVKAVIDAVTLRLLRPTHIPRMDFEEGIPDDARTLCVISALLTKPAQAGALAKRLEEYRIGAGRHAQSLHFGILADFKDGPSRETPGDAPLLQAAREEIDALNEKWGGGFYLLARERTKNHADSLYMGWERKRGAIVELVRYLRGEDSENGGVSVAAGEAQGLRDKLHPVRYVVTLDADTRPAIGALPALIEAMYHPLNRACVDPVRGVVTQGHALIQPRIAVELEAAGKTPFSRVFAGQGGSDPYGSVSSDLYQDLFSEGSFTGKGIFDVDVFHDLLDTRFPENTVLSHDLLEGCYLRAGFAGDIEFLDGFPARVMPYFDRQHRWVRGDWQILRWLFPRVPAGKGRYASVRNPLPMLARHKIADNLRRSLTAPACLVALLCALFFLRSSPVQGWTIGIVTLIALFAGAIVAAVARFFRAYPGRERFHSAIIAGVRGAAWQNAASLLFLPFSAYIHLSAICTALWRMYVTHRRMLRWITAAESESAQGGSTAFYYRRMWICLAAGALCVASLHPAGWVLGLLWAVSPAVCARIGRERARTGALDGASRAYLHARAQQMYAYFTDFMTEENHFLPPDNVQEQPATGMAQRTSPTNIGLAMLSVLGAVDLGIETAQGAVSRLSATMDTLERLEKWNGHLLNWYDTSDLRPLTPRWVSAVDSGNLLGCLIALREGLLSMEGSVRTDAHALAARIGTLADGMRMDTLYDPARKLFYIGWDLERDAFADGYYDLMASEARTASYIAIARGEIEPRHWGRLGRALVEYDGYRGMASWTGTMFEYLMPFLLMPCYDNSMLAESAHFALHCQRARRRPAGMPYGISESAFYAFDADMNYQYKANGVAKLGLRRGLSRDLVLSPYSSYLAMMINPQDALANLRLYERMDMSGQYGFYEAADLTEGRIPRGRAYMPVRCYMAHHVGMSLLSVVNVLRDGIMQKRFMADAHMQAYSGLLKERVPAGAVVIPQRHGMSEPEKPGRAPAVGAYLYEGAGYDPFMPRCTILSNGAYRLFMTDTGLSYACSGEVELHAFDPSRQTEAAYPSGTGCGPLFIVKSGDRTLSLTPAPFYDSGVRYESRFDNTQAAITMRTEGLTGTVTGMVSATDTAELRCIRLENTGSEEKTLSLYAYMEPAVCPRRDYSAHPAFSKLFLEVRAEGRTVRIHRRVRGGEDGRHARYAAVVSGHTPARIDTCRERALGRGGLFALALDAVDSVEGRFSGPESTDPCVLMRFDLTIAPGQSEQIMIAQALGKSERGAYEAAARTLSLDTDGASHRLGETMGILKLSPADAADALDMLSECTFLTPGRRRSAVLLSKNRLGRESLWKFGVSGDLPVITVSAKTPDAMAALVRMLRKHLFLFLNGGYADLVVLLDDAGDYRRPAYGAVTEALRQWDSENLLGIRGGVHIIDTAGTPREEQVLLGAAADLYVDLDTGPYRAYRRSEETATARPAYPAAPLSQAQIPHVNWGEGEVRFDCAGMMPPVAWSHTLANPAFGCLMTDGGGGHQWFYNARENKINAWTNDPLAVGGPEQVWIETEGQRVSVFAAPDGYVCAVTYGMGYAVYEKRMPQLRVRTTVFVPPSDPCRIVMVEAEGALAQEARVVYHTTLQLGESPGHARHVVTAPDLQTGALTAANPYNTAFSPYLFAALADPAPEGTTCDERAYRAGDWSSASGAGFMPCFAMRVPLKTQEKSAALRAVILTGCTEDERGLAGLHALVREHDALFAQTRAYWNSLTGGLTVKSPNAALDRYVNHWSLYQVVCCRLFARTSLYQNGGAYGFRDQLQDVLSLLSAPPHPALQALVREQLLRAASRQYEAGDVQHWWHPVRTTPPGETLRGVRTRITDDLLFLPYVAARYAEVTGDTAVFEARVPYLSSPPLAGGEHERYEAARVSEKDGTLYEHCMRAVDCVLARGTGLHGLLLIGGGDWNDGMNMVGARGHGESVWLSYFAGMVMRRFAKVCTQRGDTAGASRLTDMAHTVIAAADGAWDGAWYRRGYYDDGTPLGSAQNRACRIDAIAQAFSTAGEHRARQKQALLSAYTQLADHDKRLVRLFAPSFGEDTDARTPREPSPGYIAAYPPGVRENGGQYTHGAVWLAMGLLDAGLTDEGYRVLELLLPSARDLSVYKAEPFYLCADVYYNDVQRGRGGWSLYTGAAGWYFTAAVQNLLGLRFSPGRMHIKPRLPQALDGIRLHLTMDGARYEVTLHCTQQGAARVLLDGEAVTGGIPLAQDGEHSVEVWA